MRCAILNHNAENTLRANITINSPRRHNSLSGGAMRADDRRKSPFATRPFFNRLEPPTILPKPPLAKVSCPRLHILQSALFPRHNVDTNTLPRLPLTIAVERRSRALSFLAGRRFAGTGADEPHAALAVLRPLGLP